MKTIFLVCSLSIIPLAGTLVRSVPSPRTKPLADRNSPALPDNPLRTQLKQIATEFRAGNFHQAEALAEKGYRAALQLHDQQIASRFLNNLGGCRFALHEYREALRTFLEARRMAEVSGDRSTAGKLDFNISSLYSQLGQVDAALDTLRQAATLLSGQERTRQLPRLLLQMAALHADQGRLPQALDLYRRAIAAADLSGNASLLASALNDLGFVYLEHHELQQAAHPLLEAYRIRKLYGLRGLENSYRNLGVLSLEQGDLPTASRLLDRAVDRSLRLGGVLPNWLMYYSRGCVRLEQNQLPDALNDLRIAARLAADWRREAPPDDASRVSAENVIQKVNAALVEAGNRLYLQTHRLGLAEETFEAAEANRAASLRALLSEPRDWRQNLPPKYWDVLQELESAEAALLRVSTASARAMEPLTERIQRLEDTLVQMESDAGSDTDREVPGLLGRTRRNLGPGDAFFSFHLASPDSYLWAVSRRDFVLYRLPPGPRIANLAERFTEAVRSGRADAPAAGAELYRTLFGQLAPAFQKQPHWLLAPDAQLFEVPFAALIAGARGPAPVFLAERHSLQMISGAALLTSPPLSRGGSAGGPFVAVADPVYNTADPRWKGTRSASLPSFFVAHADDFSSLPEIHLARLAASAREAAACAAAWGGSRPPVLLEGLSATRGRLETALALHPAVLHFATHVLRSGRNARSGLIVLSLDSRGQYEVLGPVEIATWNLDGALVTLSGCSSGAADVLPATGLMGLTRACEAAGARAVVASHWRTPDDSGALFLSFYRHLHASPQAGVAAALQLAQCDMLRSQTWRSSPNYWGAYFIAGNQK